VPTSHVNLSQLRTARSLHSSRPIDPKPPLRRRPSSQPHRQPLWQSPGCLRHNSSQKSSISPLSSASASYYPPSESHSSDSKPPRLREIDYYKLFFTCKPCQHKSGPHRVSKQGYHHGSTVITCPSCKNRHVISDHLRIFTEEGGDLSDIMQRHGSQLKRGTLQIKNTMASTTSSASSAAEAETEEMIEFWGSEISTK
jgi:mitochondrial protein import protein ZIM17